MDLKLPIISFSLLLASTMLSAQHFKITPLKNLDLKTSNNAVCEGFVNDTPFVYSFAGIDSTKLYSGIHLKSYRLNTITNQWQVLPDLPDSLGKIACSASRVKDTIYIIGGYHVLANGNEVSSNKVHRFNIVSNQFLNNGSNPILPIDDQTQCVYKDSLIFVVSGWSNNSNVPNVQVYNPKFNLWSSGTSVPNNNFFKSFGSSGIIVGDTLYYLGGASSAPGFTAQSVLRKGYINPSDPLQISWTYLNPNIKAYRSACGELYNKAYWIGGSEITYNYNGIAYNGTGGVAPSNRCRRYDGTWETDSNLFLPMDLRGVAKINDSTLILAGGMKTDQRVSSEVLKLTLSNSASVVKGFPGILQVDVFPNPFSDNITVEGENIKKVSIFNSLMQPVLLTINSGKIDTGSLSPGIYFLRMDLKNKILLKKIIKY